MLEAYTITKATNHNGGWSHIDDGKGNTTLYLDKEGTTMELDEEEILTLLKALQGVNPTIQIS